MLRIVLYEEEQSIYVAVSLILVGTKSICCSQHFFLPHNLLLLREDTSELLMSIFLITLSSAFSHAYHIDCGGKAVEPRRLNV